MDYQITVAESARDALKRMRYHIYDLIVVDENFDTKNPDANGVLIYLERLQMSTRRNIFVAMVSSRYRTMYNMDGSLPIIVGAPAPTASQDAGPTILLPDPPPETVTDDNADTETTVDNVVAGRAAGSEATPSRPADEPLADPRADTRLSSATEFTLIESFVTISERDGAARITARRPAITADRFVWWTSDDTAIANEDYIPIGQPVVGFASGEEAETLHIPLINDSLPEPQETFYVFLGRHNAQLGRLEPIMRIRVDINDDE